MASKESLATSTTSSKKQKHRRRSSDRSAHASHRADDIDEPKDHPGTEEAQQQRDRRPSEQPGELLAVQSSDNLGRRFSHAATQKSTTPVLYTSDHSWQPPSVTAEAAPAEGKQDESKTPSEKKSRKKPVKGLKMPDGTYVGLEEKNKYLRLVFPDLLVPGLTLHFTNRAMQKEYLKCDYVPFCILASLAVAVIALIYLYSYRPELFNALIERIRKLLGLKQGDEEETSPNHLRQDPTKPIGVHTDGFAKTYDPAGTTTIRDNFTVY